MELSHAMNARITAPLFAATMLLAAPAAAEDRSEFQSWNAIVSTVSFLPSKPSPALWFDTHARRGNKGTTLIVRPGVGVEYADWGSVWAGYAWVPVFNDEELDPAHEHRVWQQAIFQHRTESRLAFQSRTRFEQRFSEAGDDVGLRVRQLVRASWQPVEDNPLGIALWDEVFLGMNETDWGAPQGFDQNRLFLGPFLQVAPSVRIELGYLFTYVDRDAGNTSIHALAVNLFLSAKPSLPPKPEPPPDPKKEP